MGLSPDYGLCGLTKKFHKRAPAVAVGLGQITIFFTKNLFIYFLINKVSVIIFLAPEQLRLFVLIPE